MWVFPISNLFLPSCVSGPQSGDTQNHPESSFIKAYSRSQPQWWGSGASSDKSKEHTFSTSIQVLPSLCLKTHSLTYVHMLLTGSGKRPPFSRMSSLHLYSASPTPPSQTCTMDPRILSPPHRLHCPMFIHPSILSFWALVPGAIGVGGTEVPSKRYLLSSAKVTVTWEGPENVHALLVPLLVETAGIACLSTSWSIASEQVRTPLTSLRASSTRSKWQSNKAGSWMCRDTPYNQLCVCVCVCVCVCFNLICMFSVNLKTWISPYRYQVDHLSSNFTK